MAVGIEAEPAEHDNGYDLPYEKVLQLTKELLLVKPPEGDGRFVCYKLEGMDAFSDIGRHIESVVFKEAFNNNPDQMREEYGPYEEQSTFFVSVDTEKKVPTGALRVIKNGPAGLKSLNDFEERAPEHTPVETVLERHNIDSLEDCLDIGTVAVLPDFRSGEGSISVQLYRGVYVAAMDEGVKHVVSIIDAKPLGKLTNYLGIPFEPLADSKPFKYMGSEKSQAVYGYMPDFYKKMNRKRKTLSGFIARKALSRLVRGSEDDTLQFPSSYKK